MKIAQLKQFITNELPSDSYVYLSNLFIDEDDQKLYVNARYFDERNCRPSAGLFEMNYQGKILSVEGDLDSASLRGLVGTTLDLNSFEKAYEKEVHCHERSLTSSSRIWGTINSQGTFEKYTVKNCLKLWKFVEEKNNSLKYANLFKKIIKENWVDVSEVSVVYCDSTLYSVNMVLSGVRCKMVLSQFFNYELEISFYENEEVILSLQNEEINDLPTALMEIQTRQFSLKNKVKILTDRAVFGGEVTLEEVQETSVVTSIKFDGRRGRPRRSYQFMFDFVNQEVTCLNANPRSTRFIPEVLNRVNQSFRNHEANPELYFQGFFAQREG